MFIILKWKDRVLGGWPSAAKITGSITRSIQRKRLISIKNKDCRVFPSSQKLLFFYLYMKCSGISVTYTVVLGSHCINSQ